MNGQVLHHTSAENRRVVMARIGVDVYRVSEYHDGNIHNESSHDEYAVAYSFYLDTSIDMLKEERAHVGE